MIRILVLASILAVFVSCAKEGRYLPVTPGAFGVAIPAQQSTIADSVKNAFKDLDFPELKGKSAYVEVAGVLSGSAEYYKYIRFTVEGQLAGKGLKVLPYSYELKADGSLAMMPPALAEYRILVTLDEAGADSLTQDYNGSLNAIGMKDKFFYQGRVKATVTACPLQGGAPLPAKVVEGFGKEIEIVGNYTKE